MAKSLEAAFSEFKSRLEITDWQAALVSQRRANVGKVLSAKLTLAPSAAPQVIGSWDRHTLIAPLKTADVDLLVPLDRREHGGWFDGVGTAKVLDRFKAILSEAYPETPMHRDRNCISMDFAQFRLDVVPAFLARRPIGNRSYFKIPDAVRKRWVSTDPARFAQAVTDINKRMNGTFVPLVKMAKGWNRTVGWPIRSIHLEAMLYYHFTGIDGWFERLDATLRGFSYPWMLKSFFSELPRYLGLSCIDPAAGDRLDTYLDNEAKKTRRKLAIEKARAAKVAARQAYADRKKNPVEAIDEWRVLMGEVFPTYG